MNILSFLLAFMMLTGGITILRADEGDDIDLYCDEQDVCNFDDEVTDKRGDEADVSDNVSAQEQSSKLKCPFASCERKNTWKGVGGLFYHVNAMHLGRTFMCPVCLRDCQLWKCCFSTKETLQRHFSTQHKGVILSAAVIKAMQRPIYWCECCACVIGHTSKTAISHYETRHPELGINKERLAKIYPHSNTIAHRHSLEDMQAARLLVKMKKAPVRLSVP